jgi:predicted nucleotidyltransferase
MTDPSIAKLKLSPSLQSRVETFVADVKASAGSALYSVLVFGSAARGGFDEGRSDIDVVIVLADASRKHLDALSNTLVSARNAARIECVILGKDEIPRAADVFPLFYDDIRAHHVLLFGEDPFSSLHISNAHRRLRIEQELREAQIRLRRAVVDGMGNPRSLGGAVTRKLRQIRGAAHALLALHGETVPDDLTSVLARASERWKVDTASLADAKKDPPAAHDALTKLLDLMIDDVDRLEPES